MDSWELMTISEDGAVMVMISIAVSWGGAVGVAVDVEPGGVFGS